MDEELEQVVYDVACHTEDCENAGIVIRVMAPPDRPFVVCGPCGQPITDIVLDLGG